jgi:hypothetical protein
MPSELLVRRLQPDPHQYLALKDGIAAANAIWC